LALTELLPVPLGTALLAVSELVTWYGGNTIPPDAEQWKWVGSNRIIYRAIPESPTNGARRPSFAATVLPVAVDGRLGDHQ
jgi:hypothetical protein